MKFQIQQNKLRDEVKKHIWIDPKALAQNQCPCLLWKYKQMHING